MIYGGTAYGQTEYGALTPFQQAVFNATRRIVSLLTTENRAAVMATALSRAPMTSTLEKTVVTLGNSNRIAPLTTKQQTTIL